MARKYFTLDVFSDQKLAGNPLAVIIDSDGLDGAAMQKIAAEFNLSETAFVMPPEGQENRARVRIFTPMHELPFAGHPTVGTAVLLATLDEASQDGVTMVLEEGVGPVRCHVRGKTGERSARFEIPRIPVRVGWAHDRALLAAALGLEKRDLEFGDHEVSVWNGGLHYALVPVKDLETIQKIAVDTAKLHLVERTFKDERADIYVYTHECVENGSDFHTRMFAPAGGIPEDPATGSAVACLCGQLAAIEMADNEHKNFVIEQGYEMGRPSKIHLDITRKDGVVTAAGIGGHAVIVSEGLLFV